MPRVFFAHLSCYVALYVRFIIIQYFLYIKKDNNVLHFCNGISFLQDVYFDLFVYLTFFAAFGIIIKLVKRIVWHGSQGKRGERLSISVFLRICGGCNTALLPLRLMRIYFASFKIYFTNIISWMTTLRLVYVLHSPSEAFFIYSHF